MDCCIPSIKRDIGHLCHDEQRPVSKSTERPSAKSSTSGMERRLEQIMSLVLRLGCRQGPTTMVRQTLGGLQLICRPILHLQVNPTIILKT
jgi:hypothetical protein